MVHDTHLQPVSTWQGGSVLSPGSCAGEGRGLQKSTFVSGNLSFLKVGKMLGGASAPPFQSTKCTTPNSPKHAFGERGQMGVWTQPRVTPRTELRGQAAHHPQALALWVTALLL